MVDINLSLGIGAGIGGNTQPADGSGFHNAMIHANPDDPVSRPGRGMQGDNNNDQGVTQTPSSPRTDPPANGNGNGTTQPPGTQGGAQDGLHGGNHSGALQGGVHGATIGQNPGGVQNPAALQTPNGAQNPGNPQAATALAGGDKQAMLPGGQGGQNGVQNGVQNPAALQTPNGAQNPANPQAATALAGGDRGAMLNGGRGGQSGIHGGNLQGGNLQGGGVQGGSVQGPAAITMTRDGTPPTPTELSVSIGGDGTVRVEIGNGRSAASPMAAPGRFATSDPIAALAYRNEMPNSQSGTLQLPAALAVIQQSGTSMRLDLPDGGALRLMPGPSNLRQDGGPLFSLTDFSAGRGAISETALAASRDPWALLATAFAGAGLGGLADEAEILPGQSPALQAPPQQGMLASTALNAGLAQALTNGGTAPNLATPNLTTPPGLSLAANPAQIPQNIGQSAILTQVTPNQANPHGATANATSTTFISGGQDALARLLVLGYCPRSALPLLQQTIASAPRIDDPAPALWRNQPAPDGATRALLDELERDIPLAVALGYQPMGEALRRRLQTEGPGLLQRILERVARFEGLFGQCPVLPAGKILRRGIADDGPMLRQAAKLTLGTVFQELALVAASVFPELGESSAGFLARKLSSEIILARGVRGLAIDEGVVALAPETRFVLAGRMRKADDGIHLILLAFGAEERRPILRGAAC